MVYTMENQSHLNGTLDTRHEVYMGVVCRSQVLRGITLGGNVELHVQFRRTAHGQQKSDYESDLV